MTLEQLRIFLAVAEQLHFTRAAEILYVTQPAVSAAIQSLETEYSVKLFHRVGRRIEITEAGILLQLEAQKILEQVALTERGLRELNNLQRGELRLGASLTIGNYWLPAKISHFKHKYPGISVNCTLANAEEICEGTATGLFDLGVVTGDVKPALKSVLEQTVVGHERLQVVVGKTHPWYNRARISVQELMETGWVMRESGSGAQQMFEQALQNWGIDSAQLPIVLILSSSEMVKAIVETGVGAAALPELMIQKELQLLTLRAIEITRSRKGIGTLLEIVQPIWKIKHQQRFQTKLAIAFEQILTSV
ncbi:LysR family transcriptional regulator [Leptolyngbya sp. FACHB-321]|uniref:LysR substrate-binding domain-containing protein n=1 Tax=Leptolyngbya sp. FACHB-321 TaxID=2692807 RepID=UPI001685E150|nr:LysR substrate-binding domain-containing protein [Leptolyngbya sp. FACHB-321]MBD2034321.1 LysR family transcriptional regulator [Leptolyngbya sp. FACHB-321]